MAHPLESEFRAWSKPPSATEEERCEHAEGVVRNAIRSHAAFSSRNIEVFVQGSYRNGTNVRADSDVDVCVRCMDPFLIDLPAGYPKEYFGLRDATYTYAQLKDDVERALKSYLGAAAVSRGNKAFDLHANTYRVDADVVPTFEHRKYTIANGRYGYISGTELHPDSGGRIVNWPQQNYDNGVAKNDATGMRFKKIVRVAKRLRNEMVANGVTAAKPIPSYLIECLVWNVPDSALGHDDYADDVRSVLAHVLLGTIDDSACDGWREVNGLKDLFSPSQAWNRIDTHTFVAAAMDYAAFA